MPVFENRKTGTISPPLYIELLLLQIRKFESGNFSCPLRNFVEPWVFISLTMADRRLVEGCWLPGPGLHTIPLHFHLRSERVF